MKRVRRIILLGLALVFAVSVGFWILYVPANRKAVYKAIPAEADFVGLHYRLDERFDELTRNRLFLGFISGLGLSGEEVEALKAEPDFQKWLQRLGSDITVLAHVPPGRISHRSSWLLSAWIGSRSVRLRWMFELYAKEAKTGSVAGTSLWRFDYPDLPKGQYLYCAVEEGLALAAISDTKHAIHKMVLAYQGRTPSLSKKESLSLPVETRDFRNTPDRGWLFRSDLTKQPLEFGFTEIRKRRIEGFASPLNGVDLNGNQKSRLVPPDRVAWDKPLVEAVITPEGLEGLASGFLDHPGVALGLQLSREIGDGPLFMACLGGDYRGRFKGFRVPAFLMATAIEGDNQAVEPILAAIDRLNAIYSAGLIHRRIKLADTDIYALEGTKDNLYASVAPEEQAAFAVENDLLTLTSHVGLMEMIASDRMGIGWGEDIWRQVAKPRDTSYIWVDLERGAKALRLATAVYSLKMLLENPREGRVIRDRIEKLEDWVNLLVPYKEAYIWSTGNDVVQFSLGEQ